MTPIEGLSVKVLKSIAEKLAPHLWKAAGEYVADTGAEERELSQRIETHLNYVSNWCSTYNFIGLGKPKSVRAETVSLRFDSTPRRYRGKVHESEQSELELLHQPESFMLLGDPGTGKTTTLRRLALALLTSSPQGEEEGYQFPILLILRELSNDEFLCEAIANVLGLKYTKTKRRREKGDEPSEGSFSRRSFDIKINNYEIEDVLAKVLNSTRAVVILDGLDELARGHKTVIEDEIQRLSLRLKTSKVIVTCRSGDYRSNMEGFRILEILPLNQCEIEQITRLWLDDPAPFLKKLRDLPYCDIIDRPLLLSFLLYLFKTENELPDQPSLIYRRVVYRLLKDWDEERKIRRSSQYARFDPDRKIDFLSQLAYFLTYRIKGKIFSDQLFLNAYQQIHRSFNLPSNEHQKVIREIETHTGIVISTGVDKYEFSHLSLQEFLCANYISRSPFPPLLVKYVQEYPAPVAVACALSSSPSRFFTELINRHLFETFRLPKHERGNDQLQQLTLGFFGEETVRSFLSRLLLENPFFDSDSDFGRSVFCMFAFYYFKHGKDVDILLEKFLRLHGVSDSLRLGIQGLPNGDPVVFTENAIAFTMDKWFWDIYARTTGHLSKSLKKRRIIPTVLFPKAEFEKIWDGDYTAPLADSEVRNRLARDLVGTSHYDEVERTFGPKLQRHSGKDQPKLL